MRACRRDSAIYYLIFGSDASGAAYADERVLDELHATANAPLFGAQSVYLGRGIVGGSLMPIDEVVRNAARRGRSTAERSAPEQHPCTGSAPSGTDLRLA